MTTTILSQTPTMLKTMEPSSLDDYAHGLTLIEWTERGRAIQCLEYAELCDLLRALPTNMLIAVLGERNVLCTMDAAAQSSDTAMEALGHLHGETTTLCRHCGMPESYHTTVGYPQSRLCKFDDNHLRLTLFEPMIGEDDTAREQAAAQKEA